MVKVDDAKRAIEQQPAKVASLIEGMLPSGYKTSGRIIAGDVYGQPSSKGKGAGSFGINIRGNKIGVWCDSATGEGGDLLAFVQANQGIPFKDALGLLASELGVSDDYTHPIHQRTTPKPLESHTASPSSDALPIPQWSYTPIAGTRAEAYLHSRGITLARLGLRHWPEVLGYGLYQAKSGKQIPALFSNYTDQQGATRAIQAVLLTSEGKRLSFNGEPAKKQYLQGSQPKGATCKLWPRPSDTEPNLALCEGVESALAFACFLGWPAWAVGSASNYLNIAPPDRMETLAHGGRWLHPEVELYLAPDRDKAGLSYASKALDGKASIITPQSLELTNDASLDWCDLLAVAPPEDTSTHDLDTHQALIARWGKAEQRLEALGDTPLDETTQAKAEAFFSGLAYEISSVYDRLNPLQKASVLSVHP